MPIGTFDWTLKWRSKTSERQVRLARQGSAIKIYQNLLQDFC